MYGIRKLLAGAALTGIIFWGTGDIACAAETAPVIGFVQAQQGVMWQNADGSFLQDDWLEVCGLLYHLDENGYIQTGQVMIDGISYDLSPEGIVQILKPSQDDGTMEAVAISDPALFVRVNGIIKAVTTADMTDLEKLRACYQYVRDASKYKRDTATPAGDWTGTYAMEILTTGRGNCYRYASGVAYLAKGLGFEARVATGTVRSLKGGQTPHGWAEICLDGSWYVFDAVMEGSRHVDMFGRTYENYRYAPLMKEAEWEVRF